MLVKILQFGTSWWRKAGPDPSDPYRYTRRAAYFNSTGVRCGKKIRHHWIVRGLVRFNGVGDFNPNFPNRAIGQTFECPEVTFAFGGNRLLFERKACNAATPDCYLVVVARERCGEFDFASGDWKSPASVALAVSELRDQQEAMLLMKAGDWVRTNLGIWRLRTLDQTSHCAVLELACDPVSA
jgi:hypothetical protein